MRLNQLLEAESNGTFVGVRLTEATEARILEWLKQNKIKDPTPRNELHVTLVVDKLRKLDIEPMRYNPPLVADMQSYKIELFGHEKNTLVLTFACPQLEQRFQSVSKRYQIKSDWPEYRPHITLTYTVQEVTEPLEPPEFKIELSHEYVTEFDSSWG